MRHDSPSHVTDAVLDLQREVRDGHHTLVRAIDSLLVAADHLVNYHDAFDNNSMNLIAIEHAASEVRTSIAKASEVLYHAVDAVSRL